jgi:Cft2 family RNA processing exonuclease
MIDLECIPFGVGHGDEGVCLVLKMGPYRFLLDCGLTDLTLLKTYQGQDKKRSNYPGCPVDFAICSHAHTDHARGFWDLHQTYPDLPIYASEVTAQLLPLNWLGQRNTAFCQHLSWRSPIKLAPGLFLELYPAGHLPGAAACLITYTPTVKPGSPEERSYTVFYTGDFLLSNSRLVDGLPLSELRGLNPDVLILEGSFGTARHPHRRQQENQLAQRLLQAIQQGTSVLLPVPTLGLGQELLMLMRSHHTFTGKDLDIWVADSIATGCDAYLNLLSHLPPTVQNFAQHQPLFWDDRIRPRVKRLEEEARSQLDQHASIVLESDTVEIQDYFKQSDRPWLVLLPEHHPREQSALIDPQSKDLSPWHSITENNVTVDSFVLAEHCDGPGTTQLIHNLRPQHIVFIHGSPTYLADLIGLEELANRYHLHSPGVGKRLELPIGEGLIQPTPSHINGALYEGEVHELDHEILVTLPHQLKQDPRWQNLVDTGLIEASWQGELLMLRGVSQREILTEHSRGTDADFKGCANCSHYRSGRCWSQDSTLYNLKVAPDGYCPVFERENLAHPSSKLEPWDNPEWANRDLFQDEG